MESDDLTPPPDLGRAGAVVDKAIAYLMEQHIEPVSIASALLGGSLGLLARTLDDAAVIRVLENAIDSIRTGDLQRPPPS